MHTDSTAFVALAVEHWKLMKSFGRVLDHLPDDTRHRLIAQLRFAGARLASIAAIEKIQLETFEGRTFSANLPVAPVNADEFEQSDSLNISDTLEPTIIQDGVVLHTGRVILGKDN